MRSDKSTIAAGVVWVLSLGACASAGANQNVTGSPPAPVVSVGDPAGIARARADSIRRPYTVADIHFMSAMIGHHAQAIAMSGMAPTRAANPQIKILAERIVNSQEGGIITMKQWLLDRRQPLPDSAGMKMMPGMDHGTHHAMMMPGMLSGDQMKQLERARGAEFDRLFLTFMIQHHRGAVAMVKDLFGSVGAGQDERVFKLATDVNVDQFTEIERMEKMLAGLSAERPAR